MNGHFKNWFESGQIENDWNVVEGSENGYMQVWYNNGNKKMECTLNLGVVNGIKKTWYENGKQESEGNFINGKRQGIWKFWIANGVYRERFYINDTLNGKTTELLEDKRQVFGQYQDGKETGEWIWKFPDGSIDQKASYKQGVLDGVSVAFNKNGGKREERIYKNGKVVESHQY